METIVRNQAESYFLNNNTSWFSSFRFISDGSLFTFKPSAAVRLIVVLFYVVALLLPHLIFLFSHFAHDPQLNLLLYIFICVLCISCVAVMMFASPLRSVIINSLLNEVTIMYSDPVGRFVRKPRHFSISNIACIELERVSTRSSTEYYICIKPRNGKSIRCIAFSSTDDVQAARIYFEALVMGSAVGNISAAAPQNEMDKALKRALQSDNGETSYLPFIALLLSVGLLVVGGILFLVLSMPDNTALIDGMRPVTLRWAAIGFLCFLVLLLFAAFTPYQRKNKKSLQTIIVLGLIGFAGMYVSASAVAHWCNVALDPQSPLTVQAQVIDEHYSPGSKGRSGQYYITVRIPQSEKPVELSHRNDQFRPHVGSTIFVQLHNGFLHRRWIELKP